MSLSPEARAEINRQNAQKSTGPRSAEGKACAARNACKHGLRAEAFALPNEDASELKGLTDEWVDYYQPASPGQRALVERCVMAQVQLRRSARFQAEALSKQVREAADDWDRMHQDEVEACLALVKDNHQGGVLRLKRFGAGCRILLDQWEDLKSRLDRDGCWTSLADRDTAIRLLGSVSTDFRTDDAAFVIRINNQAANPTFSRESVLWYLDPQNINESFRVALAAGPPSLEVARNNLRSIIEVEIGNMRRLEEHHRLDIEEPDRAGLGARALLLSGDEGALWLRYERMHDAAFHRSYRALLKGEGVVAPADDPAPQAPDALAPNEASAEEGANRLSSTETGSGSVPHAPAPNEAIAEEPCEGLGEVVPAWKSAPFDPETSQYEYDDDPAPIPGAGPMQDAPLDP